jgi:predicted small lipoprotein YifL
MSMKKLALLLPLFLCVAACGTKGRLETAPPMWGQARADYLAEQARLAAEKKAEEEAKAKAEAEAEAQAGATPAAPAPLPKAN